MKNLVPALGIVLFFACLAICLSNYGSQWHLNYGIPTPTIVPGTALHPDGTHVHPYEMLLIRAGIYDEIVASFMAFLILIVLAFAIEVFRDWRAFGRSSNR